MTDRKKKLRSKLLLKGIPNNLIDFYLVRAPKTSFRKIYENKLKKIAIKKFGKDINVGFIDKGKIYILTDLPGKSIIFIMGKTGIEDIELEGI